MPELRPNLMDNSSKETSPYGNTALNLQTYSLSNPPLCFLSSYPSDLICKNFKPSHMLEEPDLQGLVETEVFAGEEERFLQDDQSHLDGIVPSSFVISYHKDTFPHPLNSVKEDVEAEEAEEEKSGNFHSLDYLGMSYGPSSLSSSVISSNSLDEVNGSSDRMSSSKYHLAHGSASSMCPYHSHLGNYSVSVSKLRHPHLSNTSGKLSPAACSRLSQNYSKSHSPGMQLREENLVSKSSCICKSNQKGSNGNDKAKGATDRRMPVWHNPSKGDKLNTKGKKEGSSLLKRYGLCRAKSEVRESSSVSDNKFSSLPRKKKEKNEKDVAAETYGTLGKNRKKKDPIMSTSRDLPHESKNILDKYATLPRKKAKEISGRWRDHSNQRENSEQRPLLQRSKSIGKESTRSARVSPSPGSSASSSNVNSPRNAATASKSPSGKLNVKISSPSPRLLGKSFSSIRERFDKSPSPGIQSSNRQPKLTKTSRKHAQIQVNLKWDPNESNLEDKLRKLEDDYALLQTRLRTAEANAEEVEQLRMEAVELRRQAENERLEKEELQEELDKTSGKVKEMLTSMEGVEKEFHNREESLIELENQLQSTSEFSLKMQEKVNQYEEYNLKLRKDLDKSLAAQKILLQQVQDLEAEGREMVDFMAEEKNSLAECLKEAELELCRQRKEIEDLKKKLEEKEEETRDMVRLAEERRIGYLCLKTEMMSLQSSAEDMMVHQGAEVSGASVALANLTSRLHILTGKLIQDYSISENDIENVVTPVESDSSVSSANGTPDLPKSPIRSVNRSGSPRKPVSFMQSFLNAMRAAQNASKLILGPSNKSSESNKVSEGRKSPDGSDLDNGGECFSEPSSARNQNLSDQVLEVDAMLTRFLKVCCVLKSDADNILSELEDENERLCSQIQLQQQMIDQQYAEFESLSNLESNARKELKLITKDLEFANATLNKVCDDDTKMRVKNVDEALKAINANLGRMDTMHAEKRERISQARKGFPIAQCHFSSEHRLESLTNARRKSTHMTGPASPHIRVSLCKSRWREEKNNVGKEGDSNLNSSTEKDDKDTELDYVVNHVLKTLETVPDIVSTCPSLKDLYLHLSSDEPLTKDENCNPSNLNISTDSQTLSSVVTNGTPPRESFLDSQIARSPHKSDSSGSDTLVTPPTNTFLTSLSPTEDKISNGNIPISQSSPKSKNVFLMSQSLTEESISNGNICITQSSPKSQSSFLTSQTSQSPIEELVTNGNVTENQVSTSPTNRFLTEKSPINNGNITHTPSSPTHNTTNGNYNEPPSIPTDCNANPEILDFNLQNDSTLPSSLDHAKLIPLSSNETR